jgi:hypothetical protein
LTRLRVLIDVADGRLSVADATGLIGVGRRQVYRLLDADIDVQQIGVNMDAMAKAGTLELIRDGSEFHSLPSNIGGCPIQVTSFWSQP